MVGDKGSLRLQPLSSGWGGGLHRDHEPPTFLLKPLHHTCWGCFKTADDRSQRRFATAGRLPKPHSLKRLKSDSVFIFSNRIGLRPGPPDLYRLTGLQSPRQAPSPRDGVVEYFGKTGDRPYSADRVKSANRAGDRWSRLAPGSIEQTLCHVGGNQRHVTRQRHNMTESTGLAPAPAQLSVRQAVLRYLAGRAAARRQGS